MIGVDWWYILQATAWRNIDRIIGQYVVWRRSAPYYPVKPQRGEMFVELAGEKGFGGAAHRNILTRDGLHGFSAV